MKRPNERGLALLESAALLAVMGTVVWFGFCVTAYLQAQSGLKEIVNRHAASMSIKPLKVSAGNQGYFLDQMQHGQGEGYSVQQALRAQGAAMRQDIRALLGCSKVDCPKFYSIVIRVLTLPVDTQSGRIDGKWNFSTPQGVTSRQHVVVTLGGLGTPGKSSWQAIRPVLEQGNGPDGNAPYRYAIPGPLYQVHMQQYYGQTEVRQDEMHGAENFNQAEINYLHLAPVMQIFAQVDFSGSVLDAGFSSWLSGSQTRLMVTDQRIFAVRQEF